MPPHVKICGLTQIADLEWAIGCGVDAIGLVMATSPRRVSEKIARRLLLAAGSEVIKIAVFRSLVAADLRLLADLGFDAVQGEGSPASPVALPLLPVIIDGPRLQARVAGVLGIPRRWSPGAMSKLGHPALLLDGPRGGGGGVTADTHRAKQLASRHRIVLAGGLTPENVARSVEAIGPVAVDVSSGVERGPGMKDHGRVKAFIEAARTAAISTEASS